jgi:hypothetical protein
MGTFVDARRSTGLQSDRRWVTQFALSLLATVLLGVIGPVAGQSAATAATLHPAEAQGSVVELVQQYLSALGVAGSKFSKVEAALRALGPSATRAQVLAAVAPLGSVLAPIEALPAAPPPTTLEALGQPGKELSHDSTYQTTEDGARLDVGAKLYPNGFQVAVDDFATLTWPTHDRYTSLLAQLGEDELGKNYGGVVTVSFYGSLNTQIPFYDQGKLVLRATVPTNGFISLNLPLTHLSEVHMSFSAQGYNVIDVVNDQLS